MALRSTQAAIQHEIINDLIRATGIPAYQWQCLTDFENWREDFNPEHASNIVLQTSFARTMVEAIWTGLQGKTLLMSYREDFTRWNLQQFIQIDRTLQKGMARILEERGISLFELGGRSLAEKLATLANPYKERQSGFARGASTEDLWRAQTSQPSPNARSGSYEAPLRTMEGSFARGSEVYATTSRTLGKMPSPSAVVDEGFDAHKEEEQEELNAYEEKEQKEDLDACKGSHACEEEEQEELNAYEEKEHKEDLGAYEGSYALKEEKSGERGILSSGSNYCPSYKAPTAIDLVDRQYISNARVQPRPRDGIG
jgi:hypothetical protein